MDPFGPRPDDRGQRYEELRKSGNKPLWLLAIMAGALGIMVVVSAI